MRKGLTDPPPHQPGGFHYNGEIVQAHHLDPLSECKQPQKTKLEDLITLCPNCHCIAHFLLRKSDRFKCKTDLVEELRKCNRIK